MITEMSAASDRLVSAALNGTCQGVVLALLAGVCLRALGGTNAATRHAVWFATLLLAALLIPAHYWCRPRASGPGLAPLEAAHVRSGAANGEASGAREGGPAVARSETSVSESGGDGADNQAETLASGPDGTVEGSPTVEPPVPPGEETGLPAGVGTGRTAGRSAFGWGFSILSKVPRGVSLLLLAAWLAVAGIKLALLAAGLHQLRRLKDSSAPPSPGLDEIFQRLRSRLSGNRAVKLKVSPSHRSALVLGFVHPVIVLPAEAAQESGLSQAEAILRHELAHVRRRDDWTNLVQRLIEAGLFFHPAVWWISRQLSIEREIACDDSVLHQGVRPQPYALLLANLAGRMTGRLRTVAPGSSSSKSQLQQRIAMILNTHRNTSPRLSKARLGFITSGAALVAVLALYSGPRLVLAQTQPPAPTPATPASAVVVVADAPQAEPPEAPAPDEVQPGPKYKPGEAPPTPAAPAPVALPPLPQAPALPVARPVIVGPASGSTGFVAVSDSTAAVVPDAPPRDASIEKRLERLERMVQKLSAQQSLRRGRSGPDDLAPNAELAPEAGLAGPGPKWKELKEVEKLKSLKDQLLDPEERELLQERVKREVARATDQALREVARATEQAKRATEQAQHAYEQAASKYFKSSEDVFARDYDQAQDSLNKELEALQTQREALGQEMQRLERQIQRLQRDRGRAKDPLHGNANKDNAAPPKPEANPSGKAEAK